jgi:hypothetical protein
MSYIRLLFETLAVCNRATTIQLFEPAIWQSQTAARMPSVLTDLHIYAVRRATICTELRESACAYCAGSLYTSEVYNGKSRLRYVAVY